MSVTLVVVAYLCLLAAIANRAQNHPSLRTPLYAFLILTNAGIVLVYGFVPVTGNFSLEGKGIAVLIASLVFAGAATVVLFEPVRVQLVKLFRGGAFDPRSIPQMIALVFCIYMLTSTILEFIVAGGLSGLVQDFKSPTVTSILAQDAILVVIGFLGVGYPIRRTLPAALDRLGLRWPTLEELGIGVLMAGALVFLAYMVGVVWTMFTAPDVIKAQTELSRLISEGVNTVTFALIAAVSAAVGEEIAFRGGLQPVFGLFPTAIFFALTHIQYTLTPAALLIVMVGIGLGLLRKRYNTTVAIVAHFAYDFVLFLLPLFARYMQDVMGLARR